MKSYCKPKDIDITDKNLIERGVWKAFEGKYNRRDYRAMLLSTRIISVGELNSDIQNGSYRKRIVALGELSKVIQRNIVNRNIHLHELHPFQRRDGLSGKLRTICKESAYQQILEYVAVEALMPLFKAKLYPCQYGSIPGRGQVSGTKRIEKIVRGNPFKSIYARKTDISKAYPSTKVSVAMKLLRKDIHKNKPLLWFVGTLMSNYPDGVLIIGGYLATWLFNYVMSYVLKELFSQGRYRRDKWIPDVTNIVCYADDTTLFGTKSGLTRAINKVKEIIKEKYGLSFKPAWVFIKLPSFKEEKRNKVLRRCGYCNRTQGIDMMGYVVHRGYTIIRKRIWRRIRRQLLRAWNNLLELGFIPIWRARKLTSYNGWPKYCNSTKIIIEYHINLIIKAAKKSVSERSKLDAIGLYRAA